MEMTQKISVLYSNPLELILQTILSRGVKWDLFLPFVETLSQQQPSHHLCIYNLSYHGTQKALML
jgi:hypothetical protein